MESHLNLGKLEVYNLAIQIGDKAWERYDGLQWQDKKIIGDQFMQSVDSIGANIAEGYGRYHYLDRTKFYYNARGSLLEAKHWLFLLKKRGKMPEETFASLLEDLNRLHYKLNSLISAVKKRKKFLNS